MAGSDGPLGSRGGLAAPPEQDPRAAVQAFLTTYVNLPNYRNYWKEAGYVEEMEAMQKQVDVDGEEVVDREAVLAHQPADPAAQGETGQARVRHDAGRHRQPEGLRLPVKLAQPDPRLGPHRAVDRVDPHPLHQGEVDHQAVVAHRQAGKAVASASDSDREPNPASKADGIDDVGHPSTTSNQPRVSVDRPVPHPPMLFVGAIARTDQLAAEARSQCGSSLPVEVDGFPGGGRHGRHGQSFRGVPVLVRNLGSTRIPG